MWMPPLVGAARAGRRPARARAVRRDQITRGGKLLAADEEKVSPLVGLVDFGCDRRNAVADLFLGQ